MAGFSHQVRTYLKGISTVPVTKSRRKTRLDESDLREAKAIAKLIQTRPVAGLHKISGAERQQQAVLKILEWVQRLTKLVAPLRGDGRVQSKELPNRGKIGPLSLSNVWDGNPKLFDIYLDGRMIRIGPGATAALEIEDRCRGSDAVQSSLYFETKPLGINHKERPMPTATKTKLWPKKG